MKVLCCCSRGNCRSVSVRRQVQECGHEAIACGVKTNSKKTVEMLCKWADLILLAEKKYDQWIPCKHRNKISYNFEIGQDIWDNPFDVNLRELVKNRLELIGISYENVENTRK